MMENVGETHHPYLLLLFDVSLAQIIRLDTRAFNEACRYNTNAIITDLT
jgi:hypothetical protein